MNTCGDCRRWPADGRHSSQALERAFAKQALERAFAGQAFDEDACADPLRWKAPRALFTWDVLTCTHHNGLTRQGLWRAKARHAQPPTRGVRGFDSAELSQADKAAELHSHQAPKAP